MIYALHGNLGSPEDWRFASGLFPEGELEAVDLWEVVKAGSGLQSSAFEWCAGVPRRGKYFLLGYSLGGRLALHALLDFPEYWSGVVIVSAHPGLSEENEKSARLEKDRQWAERARHENWEDFLSAWNEQSVFGGAPTAPVLRRQLELESHRGEIARAFELWSLGKQENLVPQLATSMVPVLWVTGAGDEKFSKVATGMADVMTRGEHFAIENCGHRVLAEAPDQLAAAIGDFQKRIL